MSHYDCMDFQAMMRLPVQELAAEDCVLFLWATDPLLPSLHFALRIGRVYFKAAFGEAALGVMDRLVLSDEQWERISGLIIGRPDQCGSTGRDNRMFVEGVLWIVRTGSPWRDLPEVFGGWNSVFLALQPLEPQERVAAHVRGDVRRPRLRVPDHRFHDRAGPPARQRRKRGARDQAIGRSRGGLTTKIHLAVRGLGCPVHFVLTPGQAGDAPKRPRCSTGRRPRP